MPATMLQIRAAMELAAIAYTDERDDVSNPAKQKADIANELAGLYPQIGGPWRLVWGPASNQGVLAYVALGADRKTYVLAFRGSLSDVNANGFLKNWICNFDTFQQLPWVYPPGNEVKVAAGMHTALGLAIGLTDPLTHLNLQQFLGGLAAANGSLELLICGHSLGGALTQHAATWLSYELALGHAKNVSITPLTFAAPTTANRQFADLYDRLFRNAYACVNALDIVPMAWQNLNGIQRMYPRPGQTLTEWGVGYDLILTTYKDSLGVAYRPVGGTVDTFTGWMPSTTASFGQIAAVNHDHDTYLDHVRVETYPQLHA
jgi:hypothetical protein